MASKPSIKSFSAKLQKDNRTVVLKWETRNAQKTFVRYNGKTRRVENNGSLTVTINVATLFKLTTEGSHSFDKKSKELEVIVPDSPIASWVSQSPARFRFHNVSPMPLRIDWIDFWAKRKLFKVLSPNESFETDSFTGHLWRWFDEFNNIEIGELRLDKESEEIEFTGKDLRSKPEGDNKSFVISNSTHFPVEVIKTRSGGSNLSLKVLNPGEESQLNVPNGTVIWGNKEGTEIEVGLFLLNHKKNPEMVFSLGTMEEEEAVETVFYNNTQLSTKLYWVNGEGDKIKFKNLDPGDEYTVYALPHSIWQLRDKYSNANLIKYWVGSGPKETFTLDVDDIVVSPKSLETQVKIKNRTPFLMDVYSLKEVGNEERVGQLEPGRNGVFSTFAMAPFRLKQHSSQKDIGYFIPKKQSEQEYICLFRTKRPQEAAILRFKNNTLLHLDILKITTDREEELLEYLAPGEILDHNGKIGEAWIVRDQYSNQIVDFKHVSGNGKTQTVKEKETNWVKKMGWVTKVRTVTKRTRANLLINDNDLIPAIEEQIAQPKFNNTLPFAVDLYRLTNEGEKKEHHLESGEQLQIDSYATHAWRVRSTVSQLACALYLLKPGAHNLNLQLKSPDTGKDTYITFRNDSMLTLNVYWLDDKGDLRLLKTMFPGATYFARTFVGHFWMVKDVWSGVMVALTKGLAQPHEFSVTGETAQSQLGEEQVKVTIMNQLTDSVKVFLEGELIEKGGYTLTTGELPAGRTMTRSKIKPGSVLRAVNDKTGETMGVFITNQEPRQNFPIALRQARKKKLITAATNPTDFNLCFHGPWPAVLNSLYTDSDGQSITIPQTGVRGRSTGHYDFFLEAMLNDPDCLLRDSGSTIWIFSGTQTQKYDLENKEVLSGSKLKEIDSVFPDLPFSQLDAALKITPTEALFFRGDNCVRYDTKNKQVLEGPKKLSSFFSTDFPFGQVDAACHSDSGKGGWLFFSGHEFVVVSWDDRKVKQGPSPIEKIEGIDANTLPLAPLREGEMEVFEGPGYTKNSWILQGNCTDLGNVEGFQNEIRVMSLRLGPHTGVTLHNRNDYEGANDVFYHDASTLEDTDLGPQVSTTSAGSTTTTTTLPTTSPNPTTTISGGLTGQGLVNSYRFFKKASGKKYEIEHSSYLGQAYQKNTEGKLTEYTAYHSTLVFPSTVKQVNIRASEEVRLNANGSTFTVDAVKKCKINLEDQNRLEIVIPAVEMGITPLQIRTDTMEKNEWLVIYPDEDLYKKIEELDDHAIHQNREKLGVDEAFTQENCKSLTQMVKQLGSMTGGMGLPVNTLRLGDRIEHKAWGIDFSAAGKKEAIFYPLPEEEIASMESTSDIQVGQGWKSAWKKVKNAAKDAGEEVVKVTTMVVDEVVDNLEDELGEVMDDLEDLNIADLAKTVLKVAIKIGESTYNFVINTVQKIGAFVEFLIEQAGILIDEFVDWLKSLFDWDDILDTHDMYVETINTMLDQLVESKSDIKKANHVLFDHLDENWTGLLEGLQEDLTGKKGAAKKENNAKDKKGKMPGEKEVQWILNKITAGLSHLDPLDMSSYFADVNSTVKAYVDDMVGKLGDVAEDTLETFEGVFGYMEQAANDPANAIDHILAGMIELLKGLGQLAIKVARDIFDLILDIAMELMAGFRNVLNLKLDIPILGDLYKNLTGRNLTLLSVGALLIAVPVTVLTKAATGQAPFPNQVGAEKASKAAEHYFVWRRTYSTTHFWGLSIFDALSSDENAGGIVKGINFVLSLIAQISGNPVYPDSGRDTNLKDTGSLFTFSAEAMDSGESNRIAKNLSTVIWNYQWSMLLWDLFTIANDARNWIPIAGSKVIAVDSLLGGVHFGGMIAIAFLDSKQISQAQKKLTNGNVTDEEQKYFRRVARFGKKSYWFKTIGNFFTTFPKFYSPLQKPGSPNNLYKTLLVICHAGEGALFHARTHRMVDSDPDTDHDFVIG